MTRGNKYTFWIFVKNTTLTDSNILAILINDMTLYPKSHSSQDQADSSWHRQIQTNPRDMEPNILGSKEPDRYKQVIKTKRGLALGSERSKRAWHVQPPPPPHSIVERSVQSRIFHLWFNLVWLHLSWV